MYNNINRGFTLIELMISIGLGMMIIMTVMAAFRVAAQAVSTANRLSQENTILRAGMQIAHRDIDFWSNVDDPEDPGRQGLRQIIRGQGMPFVDFAHIWPAAAGDSEAATGYDPRDEAWAMGNPRVWWRGNMGEKFTSDLRFGRYGIFANKATTISTYGTNFGTIPSYDGTVIVPHTWLFNQMGGLQNALGFYGFSDYMPPNAVYAWYEPFLERWNLPGDKWVMTNQGGMPTWMVGQTGSFNDRWQPTPRGKFRNSELISYIIADPRFYGNNVNNLLNDLRKGFQASGYGGSEQSINDLNIRTAVLEPFLDQRPENWPSLEVTVQRFIKDTRAVCLARVQMVNPISGKLTELSFTSFGTSLRGARQQRRSGGGWATWDNAIGATNDTTLDLN